ncbi:MAG: site-specific integrase [Ruthenibacterium sp.]
MTGSLQIKSGTYYAVLNFKDKAGNRKQKWISTELETRGNKRKAEQMLNDLKTQYDESDYIAPNKILFCDFLKSNIEMRKNTIRETTYSGYMYMLNKHLYPYFKENGILLQKLTPYHIQKYYADKSKEGLSSNSLIKHHANIRFALQSAVKQGIIKENVADYADKPKKVQYIGSFYGVDEINQLLEVSKTETLFLPILLASYFGLRRSEVLGLQWNNIDFAERKIVICQSLIRSSYDNKCNLILSDHLKTASSYRELPISDTVLAMLTKAKQSQEENKKVFGNCYCNEYDGCVCVYPDGTIITPDYLSEAFSKLLKKHHLRHIRFHDLRHSCASLLLKLGYSMKDIQLYLGHSNFSTTADLYAHVDPRNKRTMIDGISNVLLGQC